MTNEELTVRDVINTMTQAQKNTLYLYVGNTIWGDKTKVKPPYAAIDSFDENQKKVFYYLIACASERERDWFRYIKNNNERRQPNMKYVIIEGYRQKDDDGTIKEILFENCIGIAESVEEAYGIAYLTLCNAIKDNDQEGETVTIEPPEYDEDNEDLFIITTSSNQKRTQDFCKIFAISDADDSERISRNIGRYGSSEVK